MSDSLKTYRDTVCSEVEELLLSLNLDEVKYMVQEILTAPKVFCDGLGRSGLAMRGFAMRLIQMGKESVLVGEATAPAFEKRDLLILCTASGSSPTLLYHAEKAKECGGKVMLITGKRQSKLAEISDGMVLIEAPDKDRKSEEKSSIQPMGALFEQGAQLVCDMMALEIMEQMGLTSEEMRKHHANIE